MSYDSSPVRRLSVSSTSSKGQEDLINAYEAEEERIMNLLSRKLEQLREQKIELENALEQESESHVNRLSRELTALRLAQQQQQQANVTNASSPETRLNMHTFLSSSGGPSPDVMLETLRKENEDLRNVLVDTERDYIRIMRLNEIYREELIEHRSRLGLSVDHLIGISSSDRFNQPMHYRASKGHSGDSSPSTSMVFAPGLSTHSVPIPRPPSQIYRPTNHPSEGNTPLSHSPSSSSYSPFPLSPQTSTNPASYLSNTTSHTTPPSSSSFNPPPTFATPSRGLTYPSVPPPSLSSSFGSPTIPYHIPHRDPSLSPTEPLSRRNSGVRVGRGTSDRRVAETGNLRHNRRESVERGGRIAETGTLRNRAGSINLPSTSEADGESNGRTQDLPI